MDKRAFMLATAASLATAPAIAQQSPQITGTWKLVTVTQTNADGSKVELFGQDPLGGVIFSPDGHFSVLFMRNDLPKFKSGARTSASPDESHAVVLGSLAYGGKYTVDADALTMIVDASTFPAWNGQAQKRTYTLKGDRLEWVGITGVQGAGVAVKLKRP